MRNSADNSSNQIPSKPHKQDFLFNFDRTARVIAGADEAGAGALAGPVVAGAVVLGKGRDWSFLRDSKVLSPLARSRYSEIIRRDAVDWALALVSHYTIDRINILNARMLAMKIALANLGSQIDLALIDGNRVPAGSFTFPLEFVVGGDRLIPEISAASILAKTARDAWMTRAAIKYPEYGFEKHFGYATPGHKAILVECGPCRIHRLTYEPVRMATKPLRQEIAFPITLDL